MGRSPSTGQQGRVSNTDPVAVFPRRTSARLNRTSLTSSVSISQAENNDRCGPFPATMGDQEMKPISIEIAIPSRKAATLSESETSLLDEGSSGVSTRTYSTPATSTAATPVESDAPGSKKRVSASARARELHSSTMSLNPSRGLKRPAASMFSTTFTTDAALAEALQAQEFQGRSPKQPKSSRHSTPGSNSSATDMGHSVENESLHAQHLSLRKRPLRSAQISNVLCDDEPTGDEMRTDQTDIFSSESDLSDFSYSLTEVSEDEDAEPQEPTRSRTVRNSGVSRTPRQVPISARSSSSVPGDLWMTRRAIRERKKLEKQHPSVTTMWDDLAKMPPIKPVAANQPSGISRTLKSFQLEGLNWMMQQEQSQYKGGLLGDEMGMGKTIQAVSLIMSDYPAGMPSLVVVPPVALMQWQSEIKEYTSGVLKVLVYHNSNPKVKTLSKKELETYDVIMISYSGLESIHRKEWKGWNRNDGIVKEDSVIHSIKYHRLILDEAHSIKQRTTSVARACFALKAKFKWCLSGTPVQNRIGEFFSLLRFLEVRPFACYFCKQCKCQQLHWSQDAEKRCTTCKHSGFSHVSVFNQEILNPITERDNAHARKEALAKLRLLTDRIMLRRIKRDHTASMELPPKRVVIRNEFFGEIERDFSRSIMTNSTRQFDTYVSRGVMLNNYANIFGLIMQMRQVANHPDLILKKHAQSGQNVLVCSICDEPAEEAIRSRCHHEFCRRCVKDYVQSSGIKSVVDCPRCHIPLSIDFEQPDIEQEEEHVKKNSIINRIRMEDWTSSTKIEMLVYELYKLRSRKQTHKSIVFSQFTSMLQLVEWRLRRAGFNTVMLDGTMTPAQRQKSIEYFMNNVDVEVFLVSLKAGGVALNLTEASRVFIIDPWWNPAAEWQSADRCHRIGQRRPCVITRLCIEDSVESRIVLLQEKKANLINGTLNKDQGEALEKLTPEDMQFLFRGS